MKENPDDIYFDRKKLKFNGLSKKVLKELKSEHAGVDIENEIEKMISWLRSPRGAAHKGTYRFIKLWLTRASSSKLPHQIDSLGQFSAIQEHFDSYLEGLWKNRNHILESNIKIG